MKILLGNIKEILSTEELNQLEKIEGDVAVHLNAIPIRVAGILDEAFAYVGHREYLHRGDGTTIVRYIRHGRKFERKIKFHSKGAAMHKGYTPVLCKGCRQIKQRRNFKEAEFKLHNSLCDLCYRGDRRLPVKDTLVQDAANIRRYLQERTSCQHCV